MSMRLSQYAVASILVRLADEGARVALALLALQHNGSTATAGVLVAALLVPHVLAAPTVGMLADRARQPRVVVATAAMGFAAALLFTGLWFGRLPLAVSVLVLLAGGCCGPALTGALSSLLPALVPHTGLPRAFGLDALTYNSAGIVGPAVAAVVAGATSPNLGIYALSGCAALGGALIALLPVPPRPERSPAARTNVLTGIRYLARNRVLAVVTGATTLGQIGMGALPIITALIAEQHQHTAAAGWLLAALAVGGGLGSLVWTWRPARPERASTVVMIGLAGVGLPLATAAVSSSLLFTAGLFAMAGVSSGPLFGALQVTRVEEAAAELRSQIFTLGAGAKMSGSAAGAAIAGLIAGHTTTAVMLLLAGGSSVLAGALGRLRLSRRPPASASIRGPGAQVVRTPPPISR